MTARDETLDAPANRKYFLDQVTRGVDHGEAAKALGMSGAHVARRFAREHQVFKKAFDVAKAEGRRVRRRRGPQSPELPPAGLPAEPPPPPKIRGKPGHTWLEEAQLAAPEGLALNPHLPRLSVKTILAECQRQWFDKNEPVALRIQALKVLNAHTLLPALVRPPSRNETGTVAEAQQPALAIPGAGPRVVVLKAPDNGMYAPGCGPGDATVVDEAEAADAELVTPG